MARCGRARAEPSSRFRGNGTDGRAPDIFRCFALACALLAPDALRAQDVSGAGSASPQGQSPSKSSKPANGAGKKKRPRVATVDVVRANLEPSYLAYPVGISGLDPLVFESDVVAHFVVNRPSWPVAFVLTPKIVVRMFREKSVPVKTPSYMPRISVYFWFQRYLPDTPTVYGSVTLSHHSNGQSGPFFDTSGDINHETGSFSTNYLEFSAYVTGLSGIWFGWSALSLEVHPSFSQNQELNGRYGQWRLHLATRLLANLPLKGEVSVQLSAILDTFMKTSQSAWYASSNAFRSRYATRSRSPASISACMSATTSATTTTTSTSIAS
jgi:hypothetical protein